MALPEQSQFKPFTNREAPPAALNFKTAPTARSGKSSFVDAGAVIQLGTPAILATTKAIGRPTPRIVWPIAGQGLAPGQYPTFMTQEGSEESIKDEAPFAYPVGPHNPVSGDMLDLARSAAAAREDLHKANIMSRTEPDTLAKMMLDYDRDRRQSGRATKLSDLMAKGLDADTAQAAINSASIDYAKKLLKG